LAERIIGHRELTTRQHRVFTVLDGVSTTSCPISTAPFWWRCGTNW
jgi:hypothetical protein